MKIQVTRKQYEDVSRFYDLVKSDHGVLEARFIHPDGTAQSRYYNDREKFTEEVLVKNSQGWTCYAGVQPRRSSLLGTGKGGNAEDVVSLRILPMELDPIRFVEVIERDGKVVTEYDGLPLAEGEMVREVSFNGRSFKAVERKKLNASDVEKMRCREVADQIVENMTGNGSGYTPPLLMDSGNGFWIVKRIPEIKITDENRAEVAARLKAFGSEVVSKIQVPGVEADGSIYDLPRIMKIPGTRVFNKPEVPGRPQRVSSFLTEGLPDPDEKLLAEFLALEVKVPPSPQVSRTVVPLSSVKVDRLFERCYALRFLKEKGEAKTSLPHDVRLALSTFSLALGTLDNNFQFIEKILKGCPDYDREKTRHYLELSRGKSPPYGCEALRKHIEKHFKDFDVSQCSCNLPPSIDPKTKQERKPSPIRFAKPTPEDLEVEWSKIAFTDNSITNLEFVREFAGDHLVEIDHQAAEVWINSKKTQLKEHKVVLNKSLREDLLARRQTAKHRQMAASLPEVVEEEEMSQEDRGKAIEKLKDPRLLHEFGQAVERGGLIGEKENALMVLLSITSRLLPERMVNLVVKGESSSGKSWLVDQCLKFVPEEVFETFTAMSSKALIYTKLEFEHRVIVFYEVAGTSSEDDRFLDYVMRTLMSEGCIKYLYTAKEGGDFDAKLIFKKGPTAFITTTTSPTLFKENETRIFSLYIDESAEQSREIILKQGREVSSSDYSLPKDEIETWKNAQRLLQPFDVHIPYGPWLAKSFPTDKIRVRRDHPRVQDCIKAVTLLHQQQREKIVRGGRELLVATAGDYAMVHSVISKILSDSVEGVVTKTKDLVKTMAQIQAENDEKPNPRNDPVGVTVAEVRQRVREPRSTIYSWLEPAKEAGLVESSFKGRKGLYRVTPTGLLVADGITSVLRHPEELFREVRESNPGVEISWVDPITGEVHGDANA